jgi:hypothetical protein
MKKENIQFKKNNISEERVIKKEENFAEWQRDSQIFSDLENLIENEQLFASIKTEEDNPSKLTEIMVTNKKDEIVYYVNLDKIRNYYDNQKIIAQNSSEKES